MEWSKYYLGVSTIAGNGFVCHCERRANKENETAMEWRVGWRHQSCELVYISGRFVEVVIDFEVTRVFET